MIKLRRIPSYRVSDWRMLRINVKSPPSLDTIMILIDRTMKELDNYKSCTWSWKISICVRG